ncbi:MAG: response regulator [Thermoguttaceae bacterium]|jgi:CheY-like chemotaxis protein|nr:response regulator [Thermoguttaceae bacterium]
MLAGLVEQPESAFEDDEQGPTILIVDDDDALTDVLALRLQKQGFETITVSTGERGLERARSQRPALIVLDLCLPDADGFEICQQLADSPDTCAIPVIILSGLEQPDILRRCRAAGCQFFVRKPYDPNVLLMLIRQSIEDAAHWDDLL